MVTVLFSFLLMHRGLYFVSNLPVLAFFLVLIVWVLIWTNEGIAWTRIDETHAVGSIILGITCLRVTKSVFLVHFTCVEPLPVCFRKHLQELVNFPWMICLHNCIAGINKTSSRGVSAGEGEQWVFVSGGVGSSGTDPAASVPFQGLRMGPGAGTHFRGLSLSP